MADFCRKFDGVKQTAAHLLMIRPAHFGSNSQTAVNNYFQSKTDKNESELLDAALKEFDSFVDMLKTNDIAVTVYMDEPEPKKPDSIFPNNWVSFHEDGIAAIYPLFAPNRRQERNFRILDSLAESGFAISSKVTFTEAELHGEFLEGTGSLVLDRMNNLAFASISPRTNQDLVMEWCDVFDFKPVVFHSLQKVDSEYKPVYHTNVMMSLGEKIAVLCSKSIMDKREQDMVTQQIFDTGRTILEISPDQMSKFAGNILLVRNIRDQKFWIMSTGAFNAFSEEQRSLLETDGKIIHSDLHTIESIGGGSARCMVAEVFLPLK